jgi:membrane protease YdiL (CAAX protease family)
MQAPGDPAPPPVGSSRAAILHAAAALALFLFTYIALVATFSAVLRLARISSLPWAWLAGGAAATFLTILTAEHGHWSLGFAAPPRFVVIELLLGAFFAVLLVSAADGLVLLTTSLHHGWGSGFPWLELVAVYLPAAVHEELVFRGYPYQKLRTLNRPVAILLMAVVFAAMHAGNRGMTPIAFTNLLLAGVLLTLAYERYRRLWLPIALHLVWNLLCGPILGYDVSGYIPTASVLTTRGAGAPWLTGGIFGIEGSVWILVVELGGIAFLAAEFPRSNSAFRLHRISSKENP